MVLGNTGYASLGISRGRSADAPLLPLPSMTLGVLYDYLLDATPGYIKEKLVQPSD